MDTGKSGLNTAMTKHGHHYPSPQRIIPVLLCAVTVFILSFSYVKAQEALSDEELAIRIESIYSPQPTKGPSAPVNSAYTNSLIGQYSGTSLMKVLDARWDKLDKKLQKRLVHYLEEPVTTGPGAPDGQQLIETEHFNVYYQTTGDSAVPGTDADNNNIPDYAEKVASYLEKSWEVEVEQMGFAPPPAKKGAKIDCHLKNLNHNGLTHAKTKVAAWIEIHCDIESYTRSILGKQGTENITSDPEGIEAGLLKACCAHEFFHCCQASYDWNEDNWWCEATAEWAGDAVFPESKFYINNIFPRFQNPHISLFSKEGWYEYASSIWAFFLSENYGGSEIIRTIWESCEGDTNIRDAIAEALGDMKEPFAFFACYNYIHEYTDGSKYPQMKELVLNKPGQTSSTGLNAPQLYGSNYFSFTPAASNISSFSLTLDNTGDEADVRLITINNNSWSILPDKLSNGQISVSFANPPEKVVVVVCSFCDKTELGYTVTVK